MELFKISEKSICKKCFNINKCCSFLIGKTCDTDAKIGKAFISKCSYFNKQIKKYESKSYFVTADTKPDSRVEMMGGGHDLVCENE